MFSLPFQAAIVDPDMLTADLINACEAWDFWLPAEDHDRVMLCEED